MIDEPIGPIAARRAAAIAGHEGDAGLALVLLGHPDAATRATALAALARMDMLGATTLAAALADPSPAVRRRAVVLAVPNRSVPLAALLADDDATVVEAAAYACGERSPADPDAVAGLSAVVTDHRDPLCREAAVAALGAIGDPDGLPAVLAATHDRATVRRRAVIALAPFSGADVDAALTQATGDRDWQVRQAAEDLLRFSRPDATPSQLRTT